MAEQQSSSEQVHVEYTPDALPNVSSAMIHTEYTPNPLQYVSSMLIMIEYIPSESVTRRKWHII